MSRSLGQIATTLSLEQVHPFLAVETEFDSGPVNLWTGLGDITVDGITYTGSGNILGISEIKETAELTAVGAKVTLSGIPSDLISLALSEPYQGRTARVKLGMTDANSAYLLLENGDYLLLENGGLFDISQGSRYALADLFVGDMDVMDIDEAAETCTISVAIESRLIILAKPKARRYTSESQKALFADDLAFDFVNSLQEKQLLFGRKASSHARS